MAYNDHKDCRAEDFTKPIALTTYRPDKRFYIIYKTSESTEICIVFVLFLPYTDMQDEERCGEHSFSAMYTL